jgi:hypothetical protein
MYLLRFKFAQICYYINTEITRSSSSFLIFFTLICYIIDMKSTYNTLNENLHMRYVIIIRMHIEICILNHWSKRIFCDAEKIRAFIFSCPPVNCIWQYIAQFNNFSFNDTTIQDSRCIDYSIPLKNTFVIELIRGAVMWTI